MNVYMLVNKSSSRERMRKARPAAAFADTVPQCPPHHWMLEEPNGPLARAQCRKCGEVKMMKTSVDKLSTLDLSLELKYASRAKVVLNEPYIS